MFVRHHFVRDKGNLAISDRAQEFVFAKNDSLS